MSGRAFSDPASHMDSGLVRLLKEGRAGAEGYRFCAHLMRQRPLGGRRKLTGRVKEATAEADAPILGTLEKGQSDQEEYR